MFTDQVDIFLLRDLAIFLSIGAMLGILIGLLLILRPGFVERANRMANRWISTRHINRWLDRSISIEHWFYRHHRVVGILVMLGGFYVLVYFGALFDKAYTLQHLKGMFPARLLGSLLDALVLGALLGGVVALMVGLFLWLRPSLLRGMEGEANRWISSRRATKILDVPRGQVDIFVTRHARRVGWLLLVGSIYLFFVVFQLSV